MTGARRVHAIYLAVIVVLVMIIVYMIARMVRASELATTLQKRYGIDPSLRTSQRRTSMLRDLGVDQLLAERTYDQYREEFEKIVERALNLGDFDDRGNLPFAAANLGGQASGQSGGQATADGPTTGGQQVAGPSTLQAACAQALRGGKRLRPIILMEIARVVSKRRHEYEQMPPVDPADAALAVECFHAGSLVVDDLPAFDGDQTRRGQPSVWAERGEGTALMAAIAIMAGAFQNVCRQVDWLREHCSEWVNPDRVGTLLCNQMSTNLGVLGAASGQFMDMLPHAQLNAFAGTPDAEDTPRGAVQTLVQRKTSPFFEMAFVGGWLVGGGETENPHTFEDLRAAGRHFGTAFQIADDIGDLEKDRGRQSIGKPGWNYADTYGREEAEREVVRRLRACRNILVEYGLFSPLWEEIYGMVGKMARAQP